MQYTGGSARSDRVRHLEIVCSGNICRSPSAEFVLREKLAEAGLDDVEVTSSGTGSWEMGQDVDPAARRALERRGYRPERHSARVFRPEWLTERTLVLGMDSGHLAWLRRAAERAGVPDAPIEAYDASGDVEDPYGADDATFDETLAQIETAADRLVERLRVR